MGVIFDLDQTIVDSALAATLRKARNWPKVYELIPKFTMFEGITDVLDFLNRHSIPTAIVTTSPRPYCVRVVKHIKIRCDHIVAYHDAQPIKPHPAPMLKALELFKRRPSQAISIGDRAMDIESSRAAGIVSVGCLWGTEEEELLVHSKPEFLISKPYELINVVQKHFKL